MSATGLSLQFSLIKRHYPHAVLGYSRKMDCLVTVRRQVRAGQVVCVRPLAAAAVCEAA